MVEITKGDLEGHTLYMFYLLTCINAKGGCASQEMNFKLEKFLREITGIAEPEKNNEKEYR